MITLTKGEIESWVTRHWAANVERGSVRFNVPDQITKLTWFCRLVCGLVAPYEQCLAEIEEWGVWESSENWHLYYSVRRSKGDNRLLETAPGHLFLPFEESDLSTFLQICLICGWDVRIRETTGKEIFISHDQWVQFSTNDSSEIEAAKELLALASLYKRS